MRMCWVVRSSSRHNRKPNHTYERARRRRSKRVVLSGALRSNGHPEWPGGTGHPLTDDTNRRCSGRLKQELVRTGAWALPACMTSGAPRNCRTRVVGNGKAPEARRKEKGETRAALTQWQRFRNRLRRPRSPIRLTPAAPRPAHSETKCNYQQPDQRARASQDTHAECRSPSPETCWSRIQRILRSAPAISGLLQVVPR